MLAYVCVGSAIAQTAATKAALGSATAKGGFLNEDEIRYKFNNWQVDDEAKGWLRVMGYIPSQIVTVKARKPHGEKADVEVSVKTVSGERTEGISIKLVTSSQGFNQIDKRWVRDYARMWNIPAHVAQALKLFAGESQPRRSGRAANRMFLNELDAHEREALIEFFAANRSRIVSDLFAGGGPHSANWMLVAVKREGKTQWTLRSIADVIGFYSEGPVVITRGSNLKIGRITMQRKGGDSGRDTAKMLQFKIDPTEILDAK